MPLDVAKQQKLSQWLTQRHAQAACPSCGTNNWSWGDIIAAPVLMGGGVAIGGPSIPMVQVICNNCAFVRLHAAVPIGIV